MTATFSLQNGADPVDPMLPSHEGDDRPHNAPEVGSELYERFMELLPQVRAEIGTLDASRDSINEERQKRIAEINESYQDKLAELDAQRKRLNGLLKAMGEEPEGPPAKRGRASGPKGVVSVSYKVLLPIMDAIERQGDDKFTALGIHEVCGGRWSEPQTYNAFTFLRTKECIGKAGKEDRPNGRTFFRILDRQAGAELRAQMEAEASEADPPAPRARRSSTKPQPPGAESVERYVAAIRAYEAPTFSQGEIEQALGLGPKRIKTTSRVFQFLVATGFLEDLGKEQGPNPRTMFRIANEDAVTQPNLFKGEELYGA